MDIGGPTNPATPGMDVLPPAGATPSSKPVITDNQPLQRDPMMAVNPRQLDTSVPATALEQPATPSPAPTTSTQQTPPTATAAVAVAEPVHRLAHQEPFFGHVGSHKKNTLAIGLVVFGILAMVTAAYFLLFMGG